MPTLGVVSGFAGITRVPRPKTKNRFLKGGPRSQVFQKVGAGGLSKSWSFWGAPNLEPRWPPDPPTWSQDNLLTPQLGAKMAPGPPTWSQDGPQTSNLEPGWPPDPPTWSQDGHQTFKSRSYFLLSPGTVAGLAVRQLDIL